MACDPDGRGAIEAERLQVGNLHGARLDLNRVGNELLSDGRGGASKDNLIKEAIATLLESVEGSRRFACRFHPARPRNP